jgi:hypothetical protein
VSNEPEPAPEHAYEDGQWVQVTGTVPDGPPPSETPWRREWDSNPRWVAPHTLSKRADSAALASLLDARPPDVAGWAERQAILSNGPRSHVMVGPCATGGREPGQGREAAAFSGYSGVPQDA